MAWDGHGRPTLGGRAGTVISVSWPVGYLPHFVAVGRGGGRPLLTRGVREYYHRENLDILHKKLKSAQRDTNLRAGSLQRDRTF